MELIKNQNGEWVLRNLDNQGNGEFPLGNLQNVCIPPFYMGLDASLRPICLHIAFDPEQSENGYENADQVGLYHVLSLRIDGFSVPGSVFPELEHTRDYQYQSFAGTYWPAVISMDLFKEAEHVRIEDIPPVYALNHILLDPACTFPELFCFENPVGFLGCPSPGEGQSSIAALRMPVGIDFLGPFEEELEEMLSSEGKEPFAEVAYPEGQTSRSFIEAELKMKYEEFDRIQEYENLRLFRYRDPENYHSYICVKWIEERRMLFFELESYEVEECQKKRMARIFRNYKERNAYRPLRKKEGKKETVDYGSDILYEMNGALFTLSGRTYALWMEDGALLGGSEYLEWNINMTWDADKLDFEQCRIVDDGTNLKAKVIKCTSNQEPLCLGKLAKAAHSETFTEGDLQQKIWFQRA